VALCHVQVVDECTPGRVVVEVRVGEADQLSLGLGEDRENESEKVPR